MDLSEEYKLRDRAYVLGRQVEELNLLVQHQATTITRLKQESLDKSRRILELEQISEAKAQVVTQNDLVFTPKLEITSVLSSARGQIRGTISSQQSQTSSQISQASLESFRIAEKKILTLEDEKQFWRRHFEEADSQLNSLKRILEEEKILRNEECRQNFSADNNKDEQENGGAYIKNLLQENYQLKGKLAKMASQIKGQMEEGRVDKENIENGQQEWTQLHKSPKRNVSKPLSSRRSNQDISAKRNLAPRPPVRNESLNREQQRPVSVASSDRKSSNSTSAGKSTGELFDARTVSNVHLVKSSKQMSAGKSGKSTLDAATVRDQEFAESMSQVTQIRDELTQRARDFEFCCCHHTDRSSSQTQKRKPILTSSKRTSSGVTTRSQPKNQNVTKKSINTSSCKSDCQGSKQICDKCSVLTCRNEEGVNFDEELDPSTIHLCQHIACLQRQVCHLKHGLINKTEESARVNDLTCQLNKAHREINELRCTCSRLSSQRQICNEENTALKRKLDVLISSNESQDSKIRRLITDIEHQRDLYKSQVEALIRDLQEDRNSDNELCTPKSSCVDDMNYINSKERRVNFTGVDLLHVEDSEVEEDDVINDKKEDEVIRLQAEVDRLQEDLHKSRLELHKLRRELMDAFARKPAENESPSKPVISCDNLSNDVKRADLNENLQQFDAIKLDIIKEKQKLANEREMLDLKKMQLDSQSLALSKERTDVQNQIVNLHRSKSTSSLPEGGPPAGSGSGSGQDVHQTCRTDISNLRKRIYFLEKQLENTENALRTNQNLMAENSKKTVECNGELLQLKQAVSQSNRTCDELRCKLDKKDDMIRLITDEKNNLIGQLGAQRDKNAELLAQLQQSSRSLAKLQSSLKDSEESEQEERRREKRLQEFKDFEKLRRKDSNLEIEMDQLNVQLEQIRKERDSLSNKLQTQNFEMESLHSKVEGLKSEVNSYIDKVKSMEILMTEKESDRRVMLAQYEQLSRDLNKIETINRNLEMQAENMTLEVKSKQADLEAVRAKCEHSDQYIENMIRQNETLRTQIISLNAKVEMLTADLQENRIARDSVLDDLNGVNALAVKLNTDKVELLHKIGEQNNEVEKLQSELANLREELMSALSTVENEKHKTKTLEKLVTESSSEIRETVIKELRKEQMSDVKSSEESESRN